MRLAYLYNEILPTRKAHDAYVWRNCAALAGAGEDVVLACGRGSLAREALAAHYDTALPPSFHLRTLAIARRNFGLPFTWNAVFNAAAQRFIARERPDAVMLSVRKQGAYHLARRLPGVRYVYEVHELEWYPTLGEDSARAPRVSREREMLARADLVTVTTEALAAILARAPYALSNAVELVPLAITPPASPVRITHSLPLHAMYIGQLYAGQGVEDLLAAAARLEQVRVTIVGGDPDDVRRLQASVSPQAASRVRFTGFVAPRELPALAASAHVLVAPFRPERRMPFVAHTKLAEYVALRRPVVAPDLPIVREHFRGGRGLQAYPAGDVNALVAALSTLLDAPAWGRLADEAWTLPVVTWASRSSDYAKLLDKTSPAM